MFFGISTEEVLIIEEAHSFRVRWARFESGSVGGGGGTAQILKQCECGSLATLFHGTVWSWGLSWVACSVLFKLNFFGGRRWDGWQEVISNQ